MSDGHHAPLTFETLGVRALNTARGVHLPTYAGLRLLLGGAASDPAALLEFVGQRSRVRTDWRYFGFQTLKEAARGRKPEYRNCIVGSPLTSLTESHVLALMAREDSFRPPACAYSYLWPASSNAGRNFAYYFEGYRERTRKTGELLASGSDLVAVVTDIKQFYPSVSKPRLKELVGRRVKLMTDDAAARTIRLFVDGLLDQTDARIRGLPVGPDLSHLLGQVALEDVDRAMQAEFGERYLRYVDDIVVVCPRSAVGSTIDRLRGLLDREELRLNDAKQDVVEAAAWRAEGHLAVGDPELEAFSDLLADISAYLLHGTDRARELHEALRAEGFTLPVARLAGQVRSQRYRSVFARAVRTGRWFYSWINGSLHTVSSIVSKAREARDGLLRLAESLDRNPPGSSMRRRWFAQRRRAVYNRLLYLLPADGYRRLLEIMPDLDEFHATRVVASSIHSGDATDVLPFPGKVTATFCQLWPEHHPSRGPAIRWPTDPGRAEGEAAAHLALRLSVLPPESMLAKIEEQAPGARILIDLCGRSAADRRGIGPLTYLDEMEHLFRNVSHESIREMLRSRFDEEEESGLEGLTLGDGDSFSPGHDPDYAE